MRINVPNQITIARLAMSVVFFALISFYSETAADRRVWLLDICFGIYLVAAVSDIVDGWIARKYGQITALGRILDPFVDKILVCGAYAFFAGAGFVDAAGKNVTFVQTWMVVLILGRELFVTGIRGYSESKGGAFGANAVGKAKMVTQSITAMFLLVSVGHPDAIVKPEVHMFLRQLFVWITVVVTALSMVIYLGRARSLLEEASDA